MARILAVSTPKVKPTRHTAYPDTPFGFGLIRAVPYYRFDHTADDERWLAEQHAAEFSGSEGWAEEELDRLAAEREWQWAYESMTPIDPDNGGLCVQCGHMSDYRTEGGYCPVCEGEAADLCSTGNHGY